MLRGPRRAWTAVAIAGLAACGGKAPPTGADTVFVVPGSHLDLGFTAPLDSVRVQRIDILDHALRAAEADPRFRWFEEGGWSVIAWLDHYAGDSSRIARLRRQVLAGRIGIGATMLSPHGAAFPEALRLLTGHLDRIQHTLGVRPRVAVLNDVPAISEDFVDALVAARVTWLLGAENLTFSPPIPSSVAWRPFWWQSGRGASVIAFLDPDNYVSGISGWGLPPECARSANPKRFPRSLDDDSVLALGIEEENARRPAVPPLTIVQVSYDNIDVDCARRLPDAIARWNATHRRPTLVLSLPDSFFAHLENRFASTLPIRTGEWGGDWDLLRASEPVWSWRLRQAMHAVTDTTPEATRLLLIEAMDHNVGLGPRWMGGLSAALAMEHVHEVARLYHDAVLATLGPRGLLAIPAPLPTPHQAAWPDAWQSIVGEQGAVARVRAGPPGFLHPLIDPSAPVTDVPASVTADHDRLLVRVRLDRSRLERQFGDRFSAVIEVRLRAPISQIALVPAGSAGALKGQWALGGPPGNIIAPESVRVASPGFDVVAHAPLVLGWNLFADPGDPNTTWLQALAFIHAVQGTVDAGPFRRPFAELYPGEPGVVQFELELVPHGTGG